MLRPEAGRNGPWRWLAWASGALFAVLALHAAMIDTPTVDEAAHLPAGDAYLEYGAYELYVKNPPR